MVVVVVVPSSGSDCGVVPPSSTCAGGWRYGFAMEKNVQLQKKAKVVKVEVMKCSSQRDTDTI